MSAALRALPLLILCAPWSCLPTRDLGEYSGAGSSAADVEGITTPLLPDAPAQSPDASAPAPAGPPPATPANTPAPEGVAGAPNLSSSGGANASLGGEVRPSDAGVQPPAATADAAASPCASGEQLGPDGHCHFFEARTLTWEAAREACQARGAGWDLVALRSAEESAFLADIMPEESWIGASDTAQESTWVWSVDGEPFWIGNGTTGGPANGAYSHWNPTEPNGGTTTNCARALPNGFGGDTPDAPWADLPCESLLASVCEAFPTP